METKPYKSNVLHPNELGRIKVTQARVRVKVSNKPKYGQHLRIISVTCATKGNILISQLEYECCSSVGTL